MVNSNKHYKQKHNVIKEIIGGSSMGGLISYYIGMKYTDVFGQVLSFSPAFWMYSEETIASVVDSYDYSNADNLPKVFLYTGGANQMEKDTIPYVDLVYNKCQKTVILKIGLIHLQIPQKIITRLRGRNISPKHTSG